MTKLIIANWKSNKNKNSTKEFLENFEKNNFKSIKNKKAIFAPPANLLYLFKDIKNIDLAIQDISSYPSGSYTGAVSAKNLEDFNIKYAIVGHSERRRYFHETNQDIANKVAQCIENNIIPILCIDEDDISAQATAIPEKYLDKIIVAYEPLEAIGSGNNASVEQVLKVSAKIKKSFTDKTQIVYGGSVNADNIKDYLEICDGVLVGGASLEAESFVDLLR